MHVPDLTCGGEESVHIAAGVELAETDAHGSFGESPDGLMCRRGAMQPGAYGNPKRLVEDGPGEGDIPVVKPERDDTGTGFRVAKDADAINLPQPVGQPPCEHGLVLGNGCYADGSDEADPGCQPRDARQVEGSRLEPPGVLLGLFRVFRLEAGAAFAKGLYWQRVGHKKYAGSHRSIESLMSRSRQDIDAQILHVDLEVPGALH